ncbi:MAG: ATP-binding protein [Mariprofundales bacterium]|nr:ATP-binding protein [Mariprofundales bacterium]
MTSQQFSEIHALRRLMLLRGLVALLVVVLMSSYRQDLLLIDARVPTLFYLLMPVLLPLQWWLQERRGVASAQKAAQTLGLDIGLIVVLLVATGGLLSPFPILFALVLIASASFCSRTAILTLTVLAAAGFVFSAYITAWWLHLEMAPLSPLRVLFHVSILFLVGGVMAALVARQDRLRDAQQQSEQEHRRLQLRHAQILDQMHEAMLLVDPAGVIVDANAAARAELLVESELPLQLMALLDTGSAQIECELAARHWLASSTRLDDGMYMILLVDTSDVSVLRDRLQAQDKLAALGQMAAQLAHEVRNPLQTIAQGVELIDHAPPEMLRQLQRAIQQEVARLNRLVGSMLEYATPLLPKPVACVPCVLLEASLLQMGLVMTPQADGAPSIQDVASVESPIPMRWHSSADGVAVGVTVELWCGVAACWMDGDHFRLVVDNLLRNAVLHAPQGSTVGLSMSPLDRDGWQLRLCDQGGGVAPDLLPRLFEPFVSGRQQGTGLGLAIVRQVCEANNWQVDVKNINVNSEPGACFTVRSQRGVGDHG